ncbi:MAG TPA: histidine kinase [Casimicrobiaceae bacterium]|nr:histidine kinase [Casimicrobiaceae bacterium]
MFTALNDRYRRFADRLTRSLTEIERRDVRAFDRWFYRERGWLWVVAIFALTTLAAAGAAQLPWNMSFLEAAMLFNMLVLVLIWTALTAWFGHRRYHGRIVKFTLTATLMALLGGFAGASMVDLINGRPPLSWIYDSAKLRHVVIALAVYAFLYTALAGLIAGLRNREYAALTRHLEAEARESELSRRLAESQLRLLQLQIEPHFLFNSLGSAQQLAEKGAPEAARLIAELIRFLRAATPTLREQVSTLSREIAMIDAYLAIMRTRLGPRLRYRIDVPVALEGASLPPGMLITLVENAIKHGIEPLPEGGEVRIEARRDGDSEQARLNVAVIDTGAGLAAASPGQGIGLANVRERLALLYGSEGTLELTENDPHGFVARIGLPMEPRAAISPTPDSLPSPSYTR